MYQSNSTFRLLMLMAFLFLAQNLLSQTKPDLLRTLPAQIGTDGKTIYENLKIDRLIGSSDNVTYKYNEDCLLIEYCNEFQSGTFCNNVIYENEKIIRIENGNWKVEYEYDEKGRLITEEGGNYIYKVRYDSLDREILTSASRWFSGGGGTGGSNNSKQYFYDSLGRISVYIEDVGNHDNVSDNYSVRKRLEYFYSDNLVTHLIEDKIEHSRISNYYTFDTTLTAIDYYYEDNRLIQSIENQKIKSRNEFFNPDSVKTTYKYKLDEYKYEDSILVEQMVSDSLSPIELYQYSTTDTLEEIIKFYYENNNWEADDKSIKKYKDGNLVDESFFYYDGQNFQEYERKTFEYDQDRITKQERFRYSEIVSSENYTFNTEGQILESKISLYRNGELDEEKLITYNYDSEFRLLKEHLIEYKNGILVYQSFIEFNFNNDGVLISEFRDGIAKKRYYYSNCGTTSTIDFKELKSVQVFPNPSSYFISLNKDIGTINIYNESLSLVKVVDSYDYLKIDVSGLTPGIYFILAKEDDNFYSMKFIKN